MGSSRVWERGGKLHAEKELRVAPESESEMESFMQRKS
jgi:hypothetical protein